MMEHTRELFVDERDQAIMFMRLTTLPCSFDESKKPPSKRPRIMNTPPAEADELRKPSPEKYTDGTLASLISGNEETLTASWERLLQQLRDEVNTVTRAGSNTIAMIDFKDLR